MATRARTCAAAGGRFFRWWRDELAGLVPVPLTRRWGGQPPLHLLCSADALIIEEEAGALVARRPIDPAAAAPPLPAPLRERRSVLMLPRDAVLRRTIELPLAAEHEIAAALSFEIDRQTPFRADDVYTAFRCRARDPRRKRIEAELAVVRRTLLDTALERLDAHGLWPSAVAVDGDDGEPRLDFMPRRRRRRRRWRAEPWKPIAATALVLLALGIAAQTWRLHTAAQALEAKVASMRAVAKRVEALRAAIARARAAERFLPEKQAAPRAIEIVEALSRLLPDDTWVFDLELGEHELRLAGFSADVPAVIERLQQDPLFEAPQLRAPVTHGPGKRGDRFELAVALKRAAP